MPDLIIAREGAWTDSLRAYKVLVDGTERAAIRQKETVTVPVEPGDHTLRLAIDFLGSDTLPFSAVDGRPVRFTCRSRWNPFLVIPGLVAGIMGKPWIRLHPAA